MTQLDLSLDRTCPKCDDHPGHPTYRRFADEVGLQELTWTNGRRYRWKLDRRRLTKPVQAFDRAPGAVTFQLEFEGLDGLWREVRYYSRRDQVWAHLRRTGAIPPDDNWHPMSAESDTPGGDK